MSDRDFGRIYSVLTLLRVNTECRSEDTVDQPDKHVTEVEGRSAELKCKYKTDSIQEDLFWYIQRANDFPKYILRRNKYGGDNGTEFQERFHSKLSSNSVPLTIKNLRVSDSAVYYCALRPTVRKLKSNHIQKHRDINTHDYFFTISIFEIY
uniref:Ig-like domain-containing protein n=1 Tax=Cyprinus carpio carpio TaxID=630221 RepID=A0A8C1BBJ1_CYPCA